MTRILTLFFLLQFAITPGILQANPNDKKQDCEQIVQIALEKLVPAVNKNDFENLESLLGTIQSACGENEFTQRMRILRALIEKKTTGAIIADYLAKDYHDMLVMRWDYSVEQEYKKIYQQNKADFNYIPLNHPIDSLVKLKATALLNSSSYNLTEQEREIALLFADHLDEFFQSYEGYEPPSPVAIETPVKPQKPQQQAQQTAQQQNLPTASNHKHRSGVIIAAGVEFPITGTDPLFKANPTISVLYSSPFSSRVLAEFGLKARVNANDRYFDYLLYDEIEHVNSSMSFSIGGNLGIKAFDNDKYIIYPKAGIYWEITNTGLTEYNDEYYYDEFGYEQNSGSVRYNNVNTMRTTLGVSFMRHIHEKKYIGLELAYHYIPYNWDSNLITSIQANYASAQLFFRF